MSGRFVLPLLLALPNTAGSALYGIYDVLAATGNIWHTLVRSPDGQSLIQPRIVAASTEPFHCNHGIPVEPDLAFAAVEKADILVIPELWLGPDEDVEGRYPEAVDLIRRLHKSGTYIYSVCSGAILLAATGLLNGCEATSHWAYTDLFRRCGAS